MMKRIIRSLFEISIVMAFSVAFNGAGMAQNGKELVGMKDLNPDFLQNQYLIPSIDHLLDNYIEGIHLQLDANASFSIVDDMRFTVEGNSFLWQKQYLNFHRIDNPLSPGTSFFKPSGHNIGVRFDRQSAATYYYRSFDHSYAAVRIDQGRLGGRLPYSDEIVNAVYGHKSSFERARGPLPFRKHVDWQIDFSGLFAEGDTVKNYHQVNVLTGSRTHIAHNYEGITHPYQESYFRYNQEGEFHLFHRTWNYMTGYLYRSRFGAETGFNDNEQPELKRIFGTLFAQDRSGEINWSTGLNWITESTNRDGPGFTRNLIDQDGEALEPWMTPGRKTGISHHFFANIPKIQAKGFSLEMETFNSLVAWNPADWASLEYPIYYQTGAQQFQSLYILETKSESFTGGLFENQFGIGYETSNQHLLKLKINSFLSADALALSQQSKFSVNFNLDFSLKITPGIFEAGIEFSRRRIPYHFEQLKFLSGQYFQGEYFRWQDSGDELFQHEEKGPFIFSTGGKFHHLSEAVEQPVIYRLAFPLFINTGSWGLGLVPVYKSFRQLWTVEYSQNSEELGEYQFINGEKLHLLNPAQPIDYNVVNLSPEIMENATGSNSFLFDQPFYASILGQVSYSSESWLLYLSFQAYMVLGFGPIGNGTLHNNLGLLSENLANPNIYIHYLGRLNSDRSFVGKLLLNHKVSDRFQFVIQVKFKDGQPFNFFNTAILTDSEANERFIIWNEGIKGDNPFTGEFNSRTDGLWNWEFRLKWQPGERGNWHVLMNFYNLLDLGMEISEFTFTPADPEHRAPLELEIPRGMSIELVYRFN